MLKWGLSIIFAAALSCATAFAADTADIKVVTSKPGATVTIDRVVGDGKLVVSVMDAGEDPIFGLSAADFSVTEGGREAAVFLVQPLAESQDMPRNIVLVLDNSYSMKERNAIRSLLQGVGELLKIVRPIDKVHIVVFENFKRMNIGPYWLSVGVLESSDPAELMEFAESAYHDKLAGKTVLYDAMLAGIELIKLMPVSEPRFMVVFSDGADLNSSHDDYYVWSMAKKVEGFRAYAIDYMPTPKPNEFLSKFSRGNHGKIWKAKSGHNIVGIFQQVASKMQYYYVLTYQFPPTGTLSLVPATLRLDEFLVAGAAPDIRLDVPELTLRPVVDSVYGISRWSAEVSNSLSSVTKLEDSGDPGPELRVPLPTDDLKSIATGGDLSVKLRLEDNNGQVLMLEAPPVKVELARTTAGLTVTPDVLRLDEIKLAGAEPQLRLDTPALTLRPAVVSPHGIASWRAEVTNSRGTVARSSGSGAPGPELDLVLPTDNLQALASAGELSVRMELTDAKGHGMVLDAPPVGVRLVTTSAALSVSPQAVTIEEVRTIDASPMLGHVYFDKGSAEIPVQYVRFSGPEQTAGFDEQKFRDAMEKYYQVLNIVGKRLDANPEAAVTLVGCNDNTGEEKGNRKLSARRAEAVRDYLQAVWSIAPERMAVEARNLPEMPSAKQLYEGQAENRRVEVRSAEQAIIAPVQSTYFINRIDTPALMLRPDVESVHGIASWRLTATNSLGPLAELSGNGPPAGEFSIPLADGDLKLLASGGDITARMELTDLKGQHMALSTEPVRVNFIQISQQLARQEGQRVQEKYALILFDFNKATIDAQNRYVIDGIAARIGALPESAVEIVGHSDNIGKPDYNIKLSENRALAAYDLLKTAYDGEPGERMRYSGIGPDEPLFDNRLPEGRSFNRTVTITLEYMSVEE